jgi:LmbE family N-acetylglucosaminyl deacetylase
MSHRKLSSNPLTIIGLIVVFTLSFVPSRLERLKAANGNRSDAIALGEAIRKLGTIESVLHTGAHPDDEDSGLLAYFARGRQARTAYLALTRGDGGQNLIGPELYEALGVIRTEELLAARRVDGAQQFFTRAFDFGFSKSRDEALSKWNQEELLRDMVRVIRTFRPLVIIPVFTGTSSDGHGHHQASGFLTPIAYRDAADPTKFPEQIAEGLKPWKAKKLFIRSGGFQQPRNEPSKEKGIISINTGTFDSLFGRSYYEVAMQGRSLHRSQDQGAIQTKGPRFSFYKVADSSVMKSENERNVFDGIDIRLTGIADFAGQAAAKLRPELLEVQRVADEAKAKYNPFESANVTQTIAQGLNKIRTIRTSLATLGLSETEVYDTEFLLKQKERDFEDALAISAGVVVDCIADDEIVTPGQTIKVRINIYRGFIVESNSDPSVRALEANKLAQAIETTLNAPPDWKVEKLKSTISQPMDQLSAQVEFDVTVAKDAEYTQSYWLKKPRIGDMFVPGKGGNGNQPQAPQPIAAQVKLEIGGQQITINQPVQYRYADKALGEIRRELKVAPAVSVNVSPNLIIIPLTNKSTERDITVAVVNNAKQGSKGIASLDVPKGWTVTPSQFEFDLKRSGERASFLFKIKTPTNMPEGELQISANAKIGVSQYREGYQTIAYPHIEPRSLYRPSTIRAEMLDVKVAPNLRAGFIEGAGDDFANALSRLGVDVRIIDAKELASGDLSKYDTIVTGIRVYEVRPDVVANNNRLLDYVKNGGTLIVQYNKNEYATGNFAPYPVKMPSQGFERVTDETAKVTILEPTHPLFNFPNKITDKDFEGWGQERGAYFLIDWDAQFKPLMASHDPNEQDKKGGEVVAEYGKGLYVYTAYAWFRQLPNGVPGAYRLIANLVSLPKARTGKAVKK